MKSSMIHGWRGIFRTPKNKFEYVGVGIGIVVILAEVKREFGISVDDYELEANFDNDIFCNGF